MLLWPAVAVLGFVALTGLVIALASSSTARFDFERNRVQEARVPAPARSGAVRAVDAGSSGGHGTRGPRSGAAPARHQESPRLAPVGAATHPAGRRVGGSAAATGWWLVAPSDDDGGAPRVLAGPFGDRLEADWAALAGGTAASPQAQVVYGVRTVAGGLLPKAAPQEGAWMVELGQQLTRLGEDWFEQVSDTDPLTTLVVEVAEAVIEAGLPLHDCAGGGPAGGICLTPHPAGGGILVSWHGHDRMTLQQLHGAEADVAVRQTIGAAVADVLVQRGFEVEPLGWSGGHLVTSGRR